MFKLCEKCIENWRVFRKRLKSCTMPWSPLAGAPWKRLRPLVTPWHGQKGEGASVGMLVGNSVCLCPPTERNKASSADSPSRQPLWSQACFTLCN